MKCDTDLGDGLISVQHQAITWTNADSFSTKPERTNFCAILLKYDYHIALFISN